MAPAIAKTHIATSATATATQPRCSSVRPKADLGLPRILSAPRGGRAGTANASFPARGFSGAASGGALIRTGGAGGADGVDFLGVRERASRRIRGHVL